MDFKFKKKYGQNFLKDEKTIQSIASSIKPKEKDLIIEIGPGSGALTKYLKKYNSYLLCYEVDTDLDEYLSKFEDEKTKIIYDDFLKRDIKCDISKFNFDNLYIVGNLPYYITTPIIMHIINSELATTEMVFMIQKEVAERFSSKPKSKNYGAITVLLNYYYNVEEFFVVKRDKFIPVPNVDSAVVSLSKKDELPVDIKFFNQIVRDAFSMKRKNLKNNFKKYDLNKISTILNECGYNLTNRAEDLPYTVFVELSNKYK